MKIGIIVHSQTGNTHAVALKFQEKLSAAGYEAVLERLEVEGEARPGSKDVRLTKLPETGHYDALIFGAPVQGFSLSPVMACYLRQIASLQGKKVACFLTQYFPYPWMGGNRAMRQMTKACVDKGALVRGAGIVNWSSKRREQRIDEVVAELSGVID